MFLSLAASLILNNSAILLLLLVNIIATSFIYWVFEINNIAILVQYLRVTIENFVVLSCGSMLVLGIAITYRLISLALLGAILFSLFQCVEIGNLIALNVIAVKYSELLHNFSACP